MMKSVFVVVLLAVAAYFLIRPTTFSIKNDIFMYKLPDDVYEFMSDLKRTIEKHSIGGKCTLLKQRTRKDGVKEKLFLVEKSIQLIWDYELPLNLEIKLTLAIPNKELLYSFAFARGYIFKLRGRMTFEERDGHAMAGTFLTEELTVTCPWLAQTFVENNLKESHKDTLISMRNGIEAMYTPKGRAKEPEDQGQIKAKPEKTSKKKKSSAGKEGKESKTDGLKKSAASGQKKAPKQSGQDKKKAMKNEEQKTKDDKMKMKTAQSAGRETKSTEEKTKRQTSQDSEKTTRRQARDEEGKNAENRKKETETEVIKKQKAKAKANDAQVKGAGKSQDKTEKEEKMQEMKEEAKQVRKEKKVEKLDQKKAEPLETPKKKKVAKQL